MEKVDASVESKYGMGELNWAEGARHRSIAFYSGSYRTIQVHCSHITLLKGNMKLISIKKKNNTR